ncbi:flagellar hook-associated protein FlgL [Clostridium oceanicum]|uniref:Flagellar hook-associated protein FlgL n=1 Tax=Clostridium oceanicum TaxID=1543 RepID=A0ABP3V1L8_9CLOT
MRITNRMLSQSFLTDMNHNMGNLSKLQRQITTEKNFSKPSDDPAAVVRSMQLHSSINANKQYNKSITNVLNHLDTTDTALGQLGDYLTSIREKLISAGNAGYGPDERKAIKDEINEMIGGISQVLNTNVDGRYVFSGTRVTSKPVDAVRNDKGNMELIYLSRDGKSMGSIDSTTGKFALNSSYENEYKMFNANLQSEISQGVVMEYNVGARDVIEFKGKPIAASVTSNSKITLPIDMKGKDAELTVTIEGIGYTLDANSMGDMKNTDDIVNAIKSASNGTDKLEKVANVSIRDGKLTISSKKVGEDSEVEIGITGGDKDKLSHDLGIKHGDHDTGSDGSDKQYNLMGILNNIVNHLDSADKDDIKELVEGDLSGLDQISSNLLKIRAEVGAKQNRMESVKAMNEQSNFDMTEILSKEEDVNITEKLMEYSVMRAVYMASLQTSAKVLQPTLMDYLS